MPCFEEIYAVIVTLYGVVMVSPVGQRWTEIEFASLSAQNQTATRVRRDTREKFEIFFSFLDKGRRVRVDSWKE